MIQKFYFLKTITTLALFSLATLASADVIRCEGGAGEVTYTNTDCGADVQATTLLLVEKPPARNVTYQQPSKNPQGRSSNWANINIAPSKGKVDKESVRSARLKIIAMDSSSSALVTSK